MPPRDADSDTGPGPGPAERPPLWPELEPRLLAEGSRAQVQPVADDSPTAALTGLSSWSTLGALARETGGILLADGWIRLFGGRAAGEGPRMPSLDEVNAPGQDWFVVGCDVLGGVFALDGGAFGEGDVMLHYFGPDVLDWTPLGIGLTAFVDAMLDGIDAELYEELRWEGWEAETMLLGLDEGISVVPMLCTRESKPLERASRRTVPMEELVRFHVDVAAQIDGEAPRPTPDLSRKER